MRGKVFSAYILMGRLVTLEQDGKCQRNCHLSFSLYWDERSPLDMISIYAWPRACMCMHDVTWRGNRLSRSVGATTRQQHQATCRHMQPQQFHCLQSVVEEAARWRFLRLGCGCGQEAAALAKLDSTDKSPGCRAPYGLQLRVEQATRHEMGHILLQSLRATSLIAKQREANEVNLNFGKILGNMHKIYGWEYVKNTIWHYDILLTGIYNT